ncbi:MAG: ATP-binding protein [Deltaproteobacteria bacterium]|nr:ATP-binding protein [Deltaproteobacteria bacterium]
MTAELARSQRSILLIGPRQTGKSTLIRSLSPDLELNFADEKTFLDFAQNPSELPDRLRKARPKSVFIDEIQRLPRTLNTVQSILDTKPSPRFYLTGSSARKLRRGRANLLPGRVLSYQLGPLTSKECLYEMEAEDVLGYGSLPGIYLEPDRKTRKAILLTYASTYLKEEIQAEALTRNLEGFARFLKVAALYSTKTLDFSKLANLAQVPRQSAVRYFEILEDTLLIHRVENFSRGVGVRQTQHPRYYFFDTGVLNAILRNFIPSEDRIGPLFENHIYVQLLNSASSQGEAVEISFFRTEGGTEVDFIVERENEVFAIEAKAKSVIHSEDLRGLRQFKMHTKKKHQPILFYLGQAEKEVDGIWIVPWQTGLKKLGW